MNPLVEKYAKKSVLSSIKEGKAYAIEKNFDFDEDALFKREYPKRVEGFAKILEKFLSNDVATFKDFLLIHNPNSRAMYEEYFDVKLPKTQKELEGFLKNRYKFYYENLESERKKLESEQLDEETKAKLKKKNENPYFNYDGLTPIQAGRLDKVLDERINWGGKITTYRELINGGYFDRKYQGEEYVRKGDMKYDSWRYFRDKEYANEIERKREEKRATYNFYVTGQTYFNTIPKIIFDAVDFERVNDKAKTLKIAQAKHKLAQARLRKAF